MDINNIVRPKTPTGDWQKHLAASVILISLGLIICSQRMSSALGFLTDDCTHLEYSYQNNLRIIPHKYLPGVVAHRPIGRDAITLLLKLFGENDIPIIWTLLFLHILNTLLVCQILYRFTTDWSATLAAATFFLLNVSVYLPIYWPGAIFDLLSTTFLGCLFLLISLIIRPRGEYRPWLLIFTLPFLLAAVKTKESTVLVIVPMLLIVLTDQKRSGLQHRLLKLDFWEIVWIAASVLLLVILGLTVISDFRDAHDPNHPYYSEYSFRVLGRSFGYFIATLFFKTESNTPMRPPVPYIILFFTLCASLLLKNRWMLLGLAWFVLFLLPLAPLKNHYAFPYYPYPANVGTALFIAGFFQAANSRWSKIRIARPLQSIIPMVFIVLLAQQSYSWLRGNSLLKWYDSIHTRRAAVVQALKVALPQPPPYTNILLVVPEVIHLDKNMSSFIRIVYHDLTLTCDQFVNEQEAEKFLTNSKLQNIMLAVWREGSFEIRESASIVDHK
jgi:hypothetical protein